MLTILGIIIAAAPVIGIGAAILDAIDKHRLYKELHIR